MSEEEFRKIAKEYAEMYFTKGIDSTKIFKYVDELEKKVERLNNIIEELEKWCNESIDNHIIARENEDTTISDTFFEIVLNKLKALKENK